MQNMIRIRVLDRNGIEYTIDAPTDMNLNLMELTKMEGHSVKGECGGMALCATCQVYIESDHALPEQSEGELDMLDQAFFVQDNSRLGCQIYLRPELDGLKVRIAPE
jgi:2Fe-2S ferredoxin